MSCPKCQVETKIILIHGKEYSNFHCSKCQAIIEEEKKQKDIELDKEIFLRKVNDYLSFAPDSVKRNIATAQDTAETSIVKKWLVSEAYSCVVSGHVGRGKTHIVAKVVRDGLLSEKNPFNKFFQQAQDSWDMSGETQAVIFTTCASMISEIQSSYSGNRSEAIINKYKKAKFLLLDDLGAEKNASDSNYLVADIIFSRHSKELKTLITSNEGDISERYDGRLASRLAEGINIKLEGEDRRLSK